MEWTAWRSNSDAKNGSDYEIHADHVRISGEFIFDFNLVLN